MKFHRSKESENLRFDKNLEALTNLDLLELVKVLEIKNFRGIFMRDTLPPQGIKEREVGICCICGVLGVKRIIALSGAKKDS